MQTCKPNSNRSKKLHSANRTLRVSEAHAERLDRGKVNRARSKARMTVRELCDRYAADMLALVACGDADAPNRLLIGIRFDGCDDLAAPEAEINAHDLLRETFTPVYA